MDASLQEISQAARKAVRLHLSEYGHRDHGYLYDEVSQETWITYANVCRRMADRTLTYGPACEEAPTEEGCEHETCPTRSGSLPAPVVLARWAARDALRDVLARDRHGKSVPTDVRARLDWERAHDTTPGMASPMRPADRGVMSAWHAEASAVVARESWSRVAGDLQAFPTLAALVATSNDSTRGGTAAWTRAARVLRPDLSLAYARTAIQTTGRREWVSLTATLDTMRSAFGADDVVGGPSGEPTGTLTRVGRRSGVHGKASDGGPVNSTPECQALTSRAPLARAYVPANGVAVEPLGTAPYYVTEEDTRAMDHRADTARVLASLGWPTSLAYAGRWAD